MNTRSALLGLALLLGSAQAVTTIQYATWDATRQKADEALLSAFQASHPDIRVKYNLISWENYWPKAALLNSGQYPYDVMWMNLDNFPLYQARGVLAAQQVDPALVSQMPQATVAPYRVGGKLYGVPLGPQLVTVFINRALFRERGVPIPTTTWTFDQMMDAARKLTFQKGGQQFYGINGNDMQTNREYGMSFYYSAGGQGIIKKSGGSYTSNLDPIFESVSKRLWDTVHTSKVSPTVETTGKESFQHFLDGHLGILIEGTWMISTWNENKKLDWAFAPFPSVDGKPSRPVMSAHALVIPQSSKHKAAAQELVTWMTTASSSQLMLANRGLLPTLLRPYRNQFAQSAPIRYHNRYVVFDQVAKSVVSNADVLSVKNLPDVLNVLEQKMTLAWTGKLPLNRALQEARTEMDRTLGQNR